MKNEIFYAIKQYPKVSAVISCEEDESVKEKVEDYIKTHKYFLNEKLKNVSDNDAMFSWYENVFHYQFQSMENTGIFSKLKHLSPFKIFDKVSKEHYELEVSGKTNNFSDTCNKIIYKESKSKFSKLLAKWELRSQNKLDLIAS